MALQRWMKREEGLGRRSDGKGDSSRVPCLRTDETQPGDEPCSAKEMGSPIQPGGLVAYRGPDGKLRGGCDEREHGTIREARLGDTGWVFTVTDGTEIPARAIVSVAEVRPDGRVGAAWTVRHDGLDGNREVFP